MPSRSLRVCTGHVRERSAVLGRLRGSGLDGQARVGRELDSVLGVDVEVLDSPAPGYVESRQVQQREAAALSPAGHRPPDPDRELGVEGHAGLLELGGDGGHVVSSAACRMASAARCSHSSR